MTSSTLAGVAAGVVALLAGAALAAPAPSFSVTDSTGKVVRLADYKGRYVVLEWSNPRVPDRAGAIRRRGDAGGAQGRGRAQRRSRLTRQFHEPQPFGVQERRADGRVDARAARGADRRPHRCGQRGGPRVRRRTTPHMFVIDPAGAIVYEGAIDDRRSARVADRKGAHNYVRAALDDALGGKPVRVASTTPYGCSVKY